MSKYVRLTQENGIATLTLDRPDKRNALRRDIIEAMLAATEAVADDESARVMVIQATGKVFCAGMDLGQMQERAEADDSTHQWHKDSQVFCKLLTSIHSLSIPTIAAVQGPALAGGMGLVLACDIVIACETAFFMLPEPIRGITAAMVTPLLIHRIGAGPATYMLLSNERITAGHSRFFGLCHDVVPEIALTDRVGKLVNSILAGSPTALALTKGHISDILNYDISDLIRQSIEVSAKARDTEDAREGLVAFLEKRKPNWSVEESG